MYPATHGQYTFKHTHAHSHTQTGPASNAVETLTKLIQNGMCVARMNFSHGDHEYHGQTIVNVRKAQINCPGKGICIALDTKGPEIRTGLLKGVSS